MCYLTKNNTKYDQNILSMVPTEDRISGHQIQGPRLCYCSATVLQSNIELDRASKNFSTSHTNHDTIYIKFGM